MKMPKSDAQIQQEVLEELAWDTRVAPTEVDVAVDARVVTLTGTVSSWAKKVACAEAAHRVAGVHDVANDLVVKITNGAQRTDTEIAAAIRQVLIWDVFTPDDKIQTTVANGIVTLSGTVEYSAERADAERAIHHLAGVRGVDNRIVVKHPELSKEGISTAIHEALERRADREADTIKLDVEGGRITVSGTVYSWGDREAIVSAARNTRGVESVIDKLHVAS